MVALFQRFAAPLVLAMLGFAAVAGEPQPAPPPADTSETAAEAAEAKAATPAAGGMIVSIDQRRGGLEESPKLSPEMQEALARLVITSAEGLVEEKRADGTVVVDLQGRFRAATVVTIGPDGKPRTSCFSSEPGHSHGAACRHDAAKQSDEPPQKQR